MAHIAGRKHKKRKIVGKKDILPAGSTYKPKTIAEAKRLGWKAGPVLTSYPPIYTFTKEGQNIRIKGKKHSNIGWIPFKGPVKRKKFKQGKQKNNKKGGKV